MTRPDAARSGTTTDINRNNKDDGGGHGMVQVASSFEINERFVKTLRDKGGQFIALRPPSILAGGNGILLIHVKIKAPKGAATTEKSAANAGSASAVGGAVDPNEASQPAPPRGSRKAEVVAKCINKILYEAGDAILDPGLATSSHLKQMQLCPCISKVPEATHEARLRALEGQRFS